MALVDSFILRPDDLEVPDNVTFRYLTWMRVVSKWDDPQDELQFLTMWEVWEKAVPNFMGSHRRHEVIEVLKRARFLENARLDMPRIRYTINGLAVELKGLVAQEPNKMIASVNQYFKIRTNARIFLGLDDPATAVEVDTDMVRSGIDINLKMVNQQFKSDLLGLARHAAETYFRPFDRLLHPDS